VTLSVSSDFTPSSRHNDLLRICSNSGRRNLQHLLRCQS
jgi:hypothetical protein